MGSPAPTFFSAPAQFRAWLAAHHATASELLVGFHKAGTGTPSMTWTESVREALCFGWIDGVRKRIDDTAYTIRFTPRKPTSIWSAVNVKHVEELIAAGLMQPAGLKAFERMRENKVGVYSFEQRTVELPEPYASTFRKAKQAWAWFEASAPSYRKAAVWWVVSAKREETREKRLATLIECSRNGERLPHMAKYA
ncbi:MAG: YdeI/OmpD-associated family protein [Gemmatimonadaceae bacterium]|nr:YdeI/OmpD-associated family protein [Gemmatimonadaceae bacterium]